MYAILIGAPALPPGSDLALFHLPLSGITRALLPTLPRQGITIAEVLRRVMGTSCYKKLYVLDR